MGSPANTRAFTSSGEILLDGIVRPPVRADLISIRPHFTVHYNG
jgi:hypothetical protein